MKISLVVKNRGREVGFPSPVLPQVGDIVEVAADDGSKIDGKVESRRFKFGPAGDGSMGVVVVLTVDNMYDLL